MLTKRIIPCLDIKDGRTVKGVNFVNLRDAGDPVELAKRYTIEGADELVFLDISATEQKRKTLSNLVLRIASALNIPFTVGGGVSSVSDAKILLRNGADKISVNSAAVRTPDLINQLSESFGNQCVVVAIDAKKINGRWMVHLVGGKVPTHIELKDWVIEVENRGAGEILFTSMDHDGTKNGFANQTLAELSVLVNIPIIASGGAGTTDHFVDAFKIGKADAALAASVFHYGEIKIPDLKKKLQQENIEIRITNEKADFNKNPDGLLPAIIQDSKTQKILMLGYMNAESLEITQNSGKVTFYSRSKKRIWTKGEESGNFLYLVDIAIDCDLDTFLIKVNPKGPTCHKGTDTCWDEENTLNLGFISELQKTIKERELNPKEKSYVSNLFQKGIKKIAQKVGEEAVETIIEAMNNEEKLFEEEAADLFFHYLILLRAKNKSLEDIVQVLEKRKK